MHAHNYVHACIHVRKYVDVALKNHGIHKKVLNLENFRLYGTYVQIYELNPLVTLSYQQHCSKVFCHYTMQLYLNGTDYKLKTLCVHPHAHIANTLSLTTEYGCYLIRHTSFIN